MALGTGALDRIRGKGLCIEKWLAARIIACPGVGRAQQIRKRRDRADRRTRGWRPTLLLEGHRWRQAGYRVDGWHRELMEEAACVGGDRLQVSALGLCVQRSECK